MPEFYIEWRIKLDADNPEDAARKALAIQRDPHSIATLFHVADDTEGFIEIDLMEIDNAR